MRNQADIVEKPVPDPSHVWAMEFVIIGLGVDTAEFRGSCDVV